MKKFPRKKISQAYVGRARELASIDTATSGHVSLPLAYRHITNSAKEVTVLAHRVGNPPESGARKAEKCKKNTGGNVARCFFCAVCIYMPFQAPQCTLLVMSCELGFFM